MSIRNKNKRVIAPQIKASRNFYQALLKPGIIILISELHQKKLNLMLPSPNIHIFVCYENSNQINIKDNSDGEIIPIDIRGKLDTIRIIASLFIDVKLDALTQYTSFFDAESVDLSENSFYRIWNKVQRIELELIQRTKVEAASLVQELYALRLILEEKKKTEISLLQTIKNSTISIPWLDSSETLSSHSITLNSDVCLIEQILPVSSRGFTAFDLHFEWPIIEDVIYINVSLHLLDSGETVGMWRHCLRGLGGWLHFKIPKSLDIDSPGMILRISCEYEAPQIIKGAKITLSAKEYEDSVSVHINGKKYSTEHLAYRIWKAPAGLKQTITYQNSSTAKNLDDFSTGIKVPLSPKKTDIKIIGALIEAEKSNPDFVIVNAGCIQLHPIPNNASILRIPNGFSSSFQDLIADISLGSNESPEVYFFMALVAKEISDARIQNFSNDAFIAQSGWVSVTAGQPSSLLLSKGTNITEDCDIVIATAVKKGTLINNAWARFLNLRARYNPKLAFPLHPKIPSQLEPQLRKRDFTINRRINLNILERPLVTIAACIHRPQDFTNLRKQIERQLYPNLEIIIVFNGLHISKDFFELAKIIMPYASIFLFEEFNLPTSLNTIALKANGEFFAKLDADDLYGENYITDSILEAQSSGAEIIGKSEYPVLYTDQKQISLHRDSPRYQFADRIAGGTIFSKTSVFEKVLFNPQLSVASDSQFLKDCLNQGFRIWSGGNLNYVHIRHDNQNLHTWHSTDLDYKFWPSYRSYPDANIWMFFG